MGDGLAPIGPLGAAQFLTRVPLRLRAAADPAATVPWFPLVGAVIGLVVGAVAAGLHHVLPPAVSAAIAVLAGVAVTGAFHEDGLADTSDAMGGWTVERRREILLDSRHGSYGVAAMVGSITLRVACVASLGPAAALGGLVAAHAVGRGAAVATMATRRAARGAGHDDGLGARHLHALTRRGLLGAAASTMVLGALAVGWWVVPAVVAAGVGAALVTAVASRALDGINGDVLGAVEQVGECLVLVVVAGLAARHPVWWA